MSIEEVLAEIRDGIVLNNRLLEQVLRSPKHKLVTVSDAAETLGISVRTVNRRLAQGVYQTYREGRSVRVDPEEIRQKMQESPRSRAKDKLLRVLQS